MRKRTKLKPGGAMLLVFRESDYIQTIQIYPQQFRISAHMAGYTKWVRK